MKNLWKHHHQHYALQEILRGPTLWSYMIQAPWNTMRIWPMKALEYHQSYESHESTRKHFENLWTHPFCFSIFISFTIPWKKFHSFNNPMEEVPLWRKFQPTKRHFEIYIIHFGTKLCENIWKYLKFFSKKDFVCKGT